VRARSAWALPLCAALTSLGSACSSGSAAPDRGAVDASDGSEGGADEGVDAGVMLTYQPTYSAIWNEILAPDCSLPFCHGGSADYLQLPSQAMGYVSLVDASAGGPDCAATHLLRVDPGHPETSLLYLKVTNPPCGSKMPLVYGAPEYLDSRQTAQIQAWIAAGAPND
jgi:hypothetical protein